MAEKLRGGSVLCEMLGAQLPMTYGPLDLSPPPPATPDRTRDSQEGMGCCVEDPVHSAFATSVDYAYFTPEDASTGSDWLKDVALRASLEVDWFR